MLAPPEPRTFLLSADVTKTLRPFLVRVFRSEGLQPAPGADAEEPAVPVVRARQPGLSWSLLWTVANVRAGQAPAGAGAGAKVNHFITSFHLTHKARLLQNLERQRKRLAGAPGAPAFEWMPRAWLLPLSPDRLAVLLPGADGADALPPPPTPTTPRAGGEPAGPPLAMVLKPTAASRGDGFHLATTWEEALPFNRAGYMLQRYVHPPDLIERRKYHVRLYLLLTALDPPRAYVHREGYIKLAMQPYVPAFTADGPVSDATAYGVHVTNHRQGNVYEADPYHPLDRLWAHFAERCVPMSRGAGGRELPAAASDTAAGGAALSLARPRGADVTAIQRSLHRALAQLVAVAVDSMREDSPPTFTEDHSFELFGVRRRARRARVPQTATDCTHCARSPPASMPARWTCCLTRRCGRRSWRRTCRRRWTRARARSWPP